MMPGYLQENDDIKTSLIDHRCGHCGALIVKGNDGAQYALKQTTLTEKQFFICSWLKNNNFITWKTKNELYSDFTKFVRIGTSAFSARISELKALEFLSVKTFDGKPVYVLNQVKFGEYLKTGILNIG